MMGLHELVDCIEVLQGRLQAHRTMLQESETRTRMALIDPLLRVLGWDVSDPTMVTPEFSTKGSRVDYALMRPDGNVAAALEAKRLGESLVPHQNQMLTYMIMSGIQYGGLTDGDRWEFYEVLPAKPLEECRLLDVSISGFAVHASTLKLLLLWRPNLAFGHPVPASAPILSDRQPAPAPGPPPVAQAVAAPASGNWVALSEYNSPKGTHCPGTIRFWDQSEQSLSSWRELLTCVAEKLHAEGRLAAKDVPVIRKNGRSLVHTEPVHPNGESFLSYYKIEATPPLFVHVHMSASAARSRTKWLLERFGKKPADVHLLVK